MLSIDIVSLFPKMFSGPFSESIVARAVDSGLVEINIHHLRDFSTDARKTVDSPPFGGGAGMILRVEPLFKAVEHIQTIRRNLGKPHVILMSPQGKVLNQKIIKTLSTKDQITVICGHYEGIDQRFIDNAVDEEISVGDYVLTGGEIPSMILIDSIVRLLPNALGHPDSLDDSFSETIGGLLQGPLFTRPRDFRGLKVPDVLLSGDHSRIKKWKKDQSNYKTKSTRPELINNRYKCR